MFPLGNVVLPGEALPLHVFEPRYRELIQACIASDDHEFGVVLIERGSEVGGGDRRRRVGTVVRLVQVAALEDGRYAAIAVGVRRVRVTRWLPDDPYPLADVEEWLELAEGDPVAWSSAADLALTRVRRCAALAVELGDVSANLALVLGDDPVEASYQLVALAPIGPADAYDLLCADGPRERLMQLTSLLDDLEATLQFRLGDDGALAGDGEER